MIDGIIKGTGNSRYLKGAGWPATYEEFKSMAEAGTLPFDLNGINAEGWQQLATALSKGTLLSDETAAMLGLTGDPTVNDALRAIPMKVGDTLTTVRTNLSTNWLLCNGDSVKKTSYSDLATAFPASFIGKNPVESPVAVAFTDAHAYNNGVIERVALVQYPTTYQYADNILDNPTWTQVSLSIGAFKIQGVTNFNGTWIFCGATSDPYPWVTYGSDLAGSLSQKVVAVNYQGTLRSIATNGTVIVTVGVSSNSYGLIYSGGSPTGMVFRYIAAGSNSYISKVIFDVAHDVFVAVGAYGSTNGAVYYSNAVGASWSVRNYTNTRQFNDVCSCASKWYFASDKLYVSSTLGGDVTGYTLPKSTDVTTSAEFVTPLVVNGVDCVVVGISDGTICLFDTNLMQFTSSFWLTSNPIRCCELISNGTEIAVFDTAKGMYTTDYLKLPTIDNDLGYTYIKVKEGA